MVLLLFLAIAAGCVALDLPSLMRKRRLRDLSVYSIFWITGIGATACALYKVNVPSPLLLVISIYKPFNNLVMSWFY